MKKQIFDVTQQKEVIVEMENDEITKIEKRQAEREAERLAREQAEAKKQAKLESAKAKLAALGLDDDEVNAILGL
jgi:DNA gyrase/topoisomerase IV subunit A